MTIKQPSKKVVRKAETVDVTTTLTKMKEISPPALDSIEDSSENPSSMCSLSDQSS